MAAVLSLVASLLWGSADFIGGLLSRRLRPFWVLAVSQAFGAVVLTVAVVATGAWSVPLDYLPWAIACSVSGVIGMLTFYRALALGPMGLVSPLAALSVLVPIGFGLLRGEQPTTLAMLGTLAAVVGVLLASGPELGAGGSTRTLGLVTISVLAFGAFYVAMAEGSRTSALMTALAMRGSTMVLVVAAIIMTRGVGGVQRRDLMPLAAIGTFDAVANLAFGVATTMGLLAIAAVLGSLYPVVTGLLAGAFLHERLRAVQYVGVAFVLAGIALVVSNA